MRNLFHLRQGDPHALQGIRQKYVKLICSLLPTADVQEVGSTAIAGMIGKQDIDLQALVAQGSFIAARALLDQHFRRDEQQLSSDIYQAYHLDGDQNVSIQLTVKSGPHDVFLAFLNILRSDAYVREQYANLKKRYDGRSMDEYRHAKQEFITNVLAASDSKLTS